MYEGEYCILREETVRERRGSYSGFCCRLYPFICWIIIKEGPGNFSGGRSPHWVNHVNLCLSCIVCLLCFCFCICFILLLRGPVFLTVLPSRGSLGEASLCFIFMAFIFYQLLLPSGILSPSSHEIRYNPTNRSS
jgi:hypothetical protein